MSLQEFQETEARLDRAIVNLTLAVKGMSFGVAAALVAVVRRGVTGPAFDALLVVSGLLILASLFYVVRAVIGLLKR
jgi:hypothetical protein